MDILLRRALSMGLPEPDDSDPEPDPPASHLPATVTSFEAGNSNARVSRSPRLTPGKRNRTRVNAARRSRSLQRNPLSPYSSYSGHHVRLPYGDAQVGARSARGLGSADRSRRQ